MPTAEDFAFSRLVAYAAYQWPGYKAAAHHRLIARKLEAVERGEIKRLMISMPPRHGKSMLASEFFPAWYMGRNPDHYVVAATYGQDLADDFGRKVKNQIEGDVFRAVFPGVKLSDDSRSARRFHVDGTDIKGGFEYEVSQRGAYYAVGIGGPLTGRGAHLLLIDDPVKDRQDAESESSRISVKDWFRSVAYTRLMPGGAIIVIQTRWHEDDLSGWLLTELAEEGWDVLSLPALDGEKALWPEKYDYKALLRIKRAVGNRDWNSLYQQNPMPDDGTFFKKDWFRRYRKGEEPKQLNKYLTSDHAPAGGSSNDFTCVRVWGIDPTGDVYLLDGFREQITMDVMADRVVGNKKALMTGLLAKHRPFAWFPEDDNNWKSSEGFVRRMMQENKTYCRIEPIPTHGGDKPTKAQPFQAMASSRRVWIPEGPEGDDVIAQYLKFPAGKNDDEVDAASLIGRAINMAHPAIVPAKENKAPYHDRWYGKFEEPEPDNWKVA